MKPHLNSSWISALSGSALLGLILSLITTMQKQEKRHTPIHLFVGLAGFIVGTLLAWHSLAHGHDLHGGSNPFADPPPPLHTALGKAESLADKGQFAKAQALLEEYASGHPAENHPLLSYEMGYFAHKAGETKNAIANLKKCVEIAPGYKDGWQLLSLAWQERGNQYPKDNKQERPKRIQAMQNSAMAMDRVAQLSNDDDFLYQSGMLWLEAEKPQKALTILEGLSKKNNAKEQWLVGLSLALQALKKNEETAEAMEKAAMVQQTPELLFQAAYLWNELDKPKRALPLLKILAEKRNPEKNWFLLLAAVYNTLNRYADAAMAFERVIEIDPAPDYLFNCGVLWLQAEKPDKALSSLHRLADVQPPKADWFVATAQAWLVKEQIAKAADAMEKAASISRNPQHTYQAGALRLQLEQADLAIRLLTPLADLKKPKKEWLAALSNAWLLKEDYTKGATYMERAATLSGEGKLYHRAGMLWRVEDRLDKTVSLLKKSVAVKEVEQLWLVDLASVLLDANRESEAGPVMKRTNLADKEVSDHLRYRGVVIWLSLREPEKAYPLLKILVAGKEVQYAWMSSLVKNCVELGKIKEAEKVLTKTLTRYPSRVKSWKLAVWFALQQGDYVDAVAAKEIVLHFEPDEERHIKDLSRLYLLAGVPKQSARFYTLTLGKSPSPEELAHLVDIYQSGRMYEEALKAALKVVKHEKTADNMKALGDIYYALNRYGESCDAYEQAVASGKEPNPDLLMRAGYAAMKEKQYRRAAAIFKQIIGSGIGEDQQIQSALQNLAYIERILEQKRLL